MLLGSTLSQVNWPISPSMENSGFPELAKLVRSEENFLENEEENKKEEEKVLPPQKNNLFNYFARKQVSKEKGPPVVEQMSKKGEASISVREGKTKSTTEN